MQSAYRNLHPDFFVPGRKPIGPVAQVPNDNLVGRWLFNGTGDVAHDLNGRYNGSLSAPSAFTEHPALGRCVGLSSATESVVDLGDISEIDNATKLTVICEFVLNDTSSDHALLTKAPTWGTSSPLLMWFDSGGQSSVDTFAVLIYTTGGMVRIEGPSYAITSGNRHVVAFTYEADEPTGLRIYVDGVEVASPVNTVGKFGIKATSAHAMIGSFAPVNGWVGDLIIESEVWSAEEIANHSADPYADLISTQPDILPSASGGLSAISIDLNLRWNTLASITNDINLRWQILNAIETDLPLAWSLLTSTTNDLQLSWNMLHALTTDLDTRWDIESALTSVSVDLGLQWNTTSAVTSDIDLRWQILTAVDSDIQLTWDLLNSATNDVQLAWDTLNALTANLDTRWSILESVNADLDLQWDIQSALSSVAADLGLSWHVHQGINADLALQWDIRHAIVATLDTRWEILNAVGVDLDMRWHIATAVAADLALQWDALENISADADLRWNTLEATESSLTLQWSIGGLMLTPISFIAVPAEQRVIPVPHEQRVLPVYH